jgi:hypothetical protein
VTSHCLKWGAFPPNEVGRIAQHVRKGGGGKEGRNECGSSGLNLWRYSNSPEVQIPIISYSVKLMHCCINFLYGSITYSCIFSIGHLYFHHCCSTFVQRYTTQYPLQLLTKASPFTVATASGFLCCQWSHGLLPRRL